MISPDAIQLRLRDIGEARPCRPDQLAVVVDELTPEDVERMTDAGLWKDFREDDLRRTVLPEFGESLYFRSGTPIYTGDSWGSWGDRFAPSPDFVVVSLLGRNYRVSLWVERAGGDHDYEAKGKILILDPTADPVTAPTARPPEKNYRGYHSLKFFGQPTWIQNPCYPQDLRGEPCRHFLTIENGWGDSGNWNILVGTDEHGVPNVAYFEASCC